jgi:hypothetical protein
MPSAPVEHVKRERVLAEVEERLRFNANLLSPRVLEVSMPPPQPIVPAIDGVTDRGKQRVELNLLIA